MFFSVSNDDVSFKFDVGFYPNGTTKVTSLDLKSPDALEVEVTEEVSQGSKNDYLTFYISTKSDLAAFLDQFPCFIKEAEVRKYLNYIGYSIDLTKVELPTTGTYLEQLIVSSGKLKSKIHEDLGVSHMMIHRMINNNDPMGIHLVLKIAKLFNVDPKVFMELKANQELIALLMSPDTSNGLDKIVPIGTTEATV